MSVTKPKGGSMKVSKLLELIQALSEDEPTEPEVRLALQPTYPFEHSVKTVVSAGGVLYIAEGRQLDYLNGDARRELGWR